MKMYKPPADEISASVKTGRPRDDYAASTARRAAAQGRTVLVWREMIPWSAAGGSGEIDRVSVVIEAIESEGWRLESVSDCAAPRASDSGVLLVFRRAATQP